MNGLITNQVLIDVSSEEYLPVPPDYRHKWVDD